MNVIYHAKNTLNTLEKPENTGEIQVLEVL